MTHSPTAFMKGTEIWLRYNENPEPRHHAYPMDEQDYDEELERNRAYWQSSFRECVWQDQEGMWSYIASELLDVIDDGNASDLIHDKLDGPGLPLDSIAERIEIRQPNDCKCLAQIYLVNCSCPPVAVLLPAEETVAEESQEELLKALLLALADKQDALSKFIIKRKEK